MAKRKSFSITLTEEDHQRLIKQAKANCRSLSAEINYLIAKAGRGDRP